MSSFTYRISASYGATRVLRDVVGSLAPGTITSLVGLSGSGKTTLSLALLRLLHYRGGTVEGSIQLDGRELLGLSQSEMRAIRGKRVAYVPQSPAAALNPRLRVEELLGETWRAHEPGRGSYGELLESVQLPNDAAFLRKFAGELSVGQGQRLLIALAILHRPTVLLADEPTSALDVITQAKVLALLRDLAGRYSMAMLFISHDLLACASVSRDVQILHEGRIVETGPPERIFHAPEHPFTRALVAAIPKL